MVAYLTYTNTLLPKGNGYPLWEPDPGEFTPVDLADIGYVSNGGFIKLFHASMNSNSNINSRNNRFPEGHTPIYVGDIQCRTPLPKKPAYISSESVVKKGADLRLAGG
jgi:hypothetical protein